jgi:dethiobiotin synthetase
VVTGVDTLLGKTYNSLGLSRSQNDVEFCSRKMETQRDGLNFFQFFMHVFIIPCP